MRVAKISSVNYESADMYKIIITRGYKSVILAVTDKNDDAVSWSLLSLPHATNSMENEKRTKEFILECLIKLKSLGIKHAMVIQNGVSKYGMELLKALISDDDIDIESIQDCTKIPHHGVRLSSRGRHTI